MTDPGARNLRNGGHMFMRGKMRMPLFSQGQPVVTPYCPEW